MGIKPLQDRVLVQRLQSEEKTSSGLYIPDSAKEKPLEALVRAVGPDAEGVSEGDKVLFGKYSGTEITIGGEEHLILRVEEILAIITD